MERLGRVRLCVLAACLVGASVTAAELDGTYTDTKVIDKVLASIPFTDKSMTYANLGERLPNLGLRVESINVGKFTVDDIRAESGRLRRGDIDYVFRTNEPNSAVKAICQIGSSFNLIRRGKQWIAQDRTANFLVNGMAHCAVP